MVLTVFYNAVLIIIGIILIITASLGINLHNRCSTSSSDSVSRGEQGYFIFVLIVGIILLIIPLIIFIYEQNFRSKTTQRIEGVELGAIR